jgi:hypothetical protein
MKLLSAKDQDGSVVWINPDNICFIHKMSYGAVITFTGGGVIRVTELINNVSTTTLPDRTCEVRDLIR